MTIPNPAWHGRQVSPLTATAIATGLFKGIVVSHEDQAKPLYQYGITHDDAIGPPLSGSCATGSRHQNGKPASCGEVEQAIVAAHGALELAHLGAYT